MDLHSNHGHPQSAGLHLPEGACFMSTIRVYTLEFRESTVGLVLSQGLSIRVAAEDLGVLATRCTVRFANKGVRGEGRLPRRRAKNGGSPSRELWCASTQSRVEFTAHRRSRASFRNLVSLLIATRPRESCKNAESVRNMYESTVQQLRRVRTRMRRRQIFLSVTSPQTDQTRSGCATSPTFQLTKASCISRA